MKCVLTTLQKCLCYNLREDQIYLYCSSMEVKGEVKKKEGREREEERRAELKRKELEDEEDDEDVERALKAAKQTRIELSRQCPYLDTIDRYFSVGLGFVTNVLLYHTKLMNFRGVLDFDFEKLCSVSLSR